MGQIDDRHVEWAVVNRLRAMLDEPPETKFNVTQAFALFSTIVLWSKNRAWVAGRKLQRQEWESPAHHQAHDVREALHEARIFDEPWRLSQMQPKIVLVDREERPLEINQDFAKMTAEAFIKWLRDALAHGDGRTITPIHKVSRRGDKALLAGFRIEFEERNGSDRKLALDLYHSDMRRIGRNLADLFCQSLSGGDRYFEQDAATKVEELAALVGR